MSQQSEWTAADEDEAHEHFAAYLSTLPPQPSPWDAQAVAHLAAGVVLVVVHAVSLTCGVLGAIWLLVK